MFYASDLHIVLIATNSSIFCQEMLIAKQGRGPAGAPLTGLKKPRSHTDGAYKCNNILYLQDEMCKIFLISCKIKYLKLSID